MSCCHDSVPKQCLISTFLSSVHREDSKLRHHFLARMVEDRAESAFSYVEFLQHVKAKIR